MARFACHQSLLKSEDIQDVAKVSSGSAWFPLVDQSSLRPATKTGAHATCLNDADHADAPALTTHGFQPTLTTKQFFSVIDKILNITNLFTSLGYSWKN